VCETTRKRKKVVGSDIKRKEEGVDGFSLVKEEWEGLFV
jgi:hypothetical protein